MKIDLVFRGNRPRRTCNCNLITVLYPMSRPFSNIARRTEIDETSVLNYINSMHQLGVVTVWSQSRGALDLAPLAD